nr:hypothetical protein BaRGS_030155 [Batillaria attramentaria]
MNDLPIPRYARVNLLKTTVDDVIRAFGDEGWASCFPAHVLDPPYGTTVLDCCAAPGNKTSHTASLLGNSGRIVAYERDAKRMSLLRQQLKKSGFFFLWAGIISRMDHVANNKKSSFTSSSQRLQNLARFQISILKHALQFPAAQRVVYSTCSVHEEENEAVVSEVAAQVHGKFTDDDRNTQPDIASSEGTSEEKPQKKKKKRKKDKEKRTDANDIPDSSPLCFVNAGAELSPHDGDPVGTHSEETHCLPKKRKKKKIRREEKRDQESLENVACNEESALSVNSASQDNLLTSVQKSCVEDCEAKAKKKKKKKRKERIL